MNVKDLKEELKKERDSLIEEARFKTVEEQGFYYKIANEITDKIIEIEKLEENKKNKKIDILSNLGIGIVVPVILKAVEIGFIAHQTKVILHFEETGHMILSTPGKGLARLFSMKV